jgi:SAM-dependent methyltransferase
VPWGDMPEHWYEAYDRGRPGYPDAVVDVAAVPSAGTVLELAAGTGRLTGILRSHFAHVIATEPDPGMRRFLAPRRATAHVVAASANDVALAAASVDAVFAAQAFHQFDAPRAVAEMVRVLRPGGALILLWNVPAGPAEPSLAAVEELLAPDWPAGWDPLDLGVGYGGSGWIADITASPFGEVHEERMPNPQTVDRDGLVAFFTSMGWIAVKPDEERSRLLDGVRALLTSEQYVLPWETRLHWARLP